VDVLDPIRERIARRRTDAGRQRAGHAGKREGALERVLDGMARPLIVDRGMAADAVAAEVARARVSVLGTLGAVQRIRVVRATRRIAAGPGGRAHRVCTRVVADASAVDRDVSALPGDAHVVGAREAVVGAGDRDTDAPAGAAVVRPRARVTVVAGRTVDRGVRARFPLAPVLRARVVIVARLRAPMLLLVLVVVVVQPSEGRRGADQDEDQVRDDGPHPAVVSAGRAATHPLRKPSVLTVLLARRTPARRGLSARSARGRAPASEEWGPRRALLDGGEERSSSRRLV